MSNQDRAEGVEPAYPWRPIAELDPSDDEHWFLREDSRGGWVIDGPRATQSESEDEADGWQWFARCEAPPIVAQPRDAAGDEYLPAGWYTFVHDCAQLRGTMVEGNGLADCANRLLEGAPQAPGCEISDDVAKRAAQVFLENVANHQKGLEVDLFAMRKVLEDFRSTTPPATPEGEVAFYVQPKLLDVVGQISSVQKEHRIVVTTEPTATHSLPLYTRPAESSGGDAVDAPEGYSVPAQGDQWHIPQSTHQSLLDRVEALAGELENEARAHDNQYDARRSAELNEWDEAMSESKADAATRMRRLVADAKNGELT